MSSNSTFQRSHDNGMLMKGIIRKITLWNFVSYDYIEIIPGPKLNLILGPNGAGKSSIVSAIVLSLGGSPKDLGREINVKEFIKNGANSGKIQIELFNPDGDDFVISRKITQKGSLWTMNQKSASLGDIQEFTKKLNIQVDNLCQILPQEKVLDFSRMNAPTLLKNTEKAIGPVELRENHEALIEFTLKIRESENELKATKEKLRKEERICEKLKSQVANLRERESLLKNIEHLKVKRAWLTYSRKKEELEEFKTKMEESKKSLEDCRTSESRIEALKVTAERKANTIRSQMQNTNSALQKNSDLIDRLSSKVHETQTSICEYEETLKCHSDNEVKREQEAKVMEQIIAELENDQLASKKPDQFYMNDIKTCEDKIRVHRVSVQNIESQIAKCKKNLENIKHAMVAEEAAQEKAKNFKRHREEALAKHFPDVYRGVLWLRDNRHLFSGNVFEPMLLEISIPKPEHAKYFEYIIPMRDLQAFICEEKEDLRILISKLREEQKLKINVLHSGNEHPPSDFYQPDTPIQSLRQFGFVAYLRDLFTAPETIMKYLCRRLFIYRIPLGTARTNDVYDQVPLTIRAFFSNNTKYDVSVSKYSHERCTTATLVSDKRLLNSTIDVEAIKQAERKLASLHKDRDLMTESLSKMEEEHVKLVSEMDIMREKRDKVYELHNAHKHLKIRLKMKRQNLAKVRSDLNKLEQEIAQNKSKIRSAIQELCTDMKTCQEAIKNQISFMKRTEKFEFELMDARKERDQANAELENLRFKHKDTRRKVRVMEIEYTRIKSAVESTLKRAKELSPDHRSVPDLSSSTLEAVVEQFNEAIAKVSCLTHVDGEVIKQYEESLNEIDKLKHKVEHFVCDMNSLREKVAGLKDRWLMLVNNLVQRINENFGKFLSAMGCAGEVLLSQESGPEDFENYGIDIRVKYHENDSFQLLTKQLQSGGEKTVATAIYLIAMQEITCVPFRCVDEINQGMDPSNERRVFNTLVNAVRLNNSQYFFLTPKLLPELGYSKDVTSIFIFCGESQRNAKFTGPEESGDDCDVSSTSKHINISQCLKFYQSHNG